MIRLILSMLIHCIFYHLFVIAVPLQTNTLYAMKLNDLFVGCTSDPCQLIASTYDSDVIRFQISDPFKTNIEDVTLQTQYCIRVEKSDETRQYFLVPEYNTTTDSYQIKFDSTCLTENSWEFEDELDTKYPLVIKYVGEADDSKAYLSLNKNMEATLGEKLDATETDIQLLDYNGLLTNKWYNAFAIDYLGAYRGMKCVYKNPNENCAVELTTLSDEGLAMKVQFEPRGINNAHINPSRRTMRIRYQQQNLDEGTIETGYLTFDTTKDLVNLEGTSIENDAIRFQLVSLGDELPRIATFVSIGYTIGFDGNSVVMSGDEEKVSQRIQLTLLEEE